MAILDLSKLHMYSFFYDVLKPKYGEKVNLAYTDTDSFIIHTETEDIYTDFNNLQEHMDFSDYPPDHPNFNKANKKVLGKFKDEVNGKVISEFVGLKPKMYAFNIDEKHITDKQDTQHRKAKGIPKKR